MLYKPQVLLPLALLAVATGSYVASIGTSFVPSSVRPRRSQTTNRSAGKVTRMNTSSDTSTQDEIENYKGGDYKVFVGRGMARFRSGRVAASISDFDTAIALQPSLTPYMWQRGLSLYYADRFEEGAKQFRRDIAVNPNDTEEVIWAFLCDAKTVGVGFDGARKRLPKSINERRPYMRAAYAMFLGESKEDELAMQMTKSAINDDAKSATAYFYANLYLGLYSEAKGDDALAQKYIKAAVRSTYGKSGDYMYDVARIHESVRGW